MALTSNEIPKFTDRENPDAEVQIGTVQRSYVGDDIIDTVDCRSSANREWQMQSINKGEWSEVGYTPPEEGTGA